MKKVWKLASLVCTAVLILSTLLTGCGTEKTASGVKELTWCVVGDETKDSPEVMERVNAILEEKLGLRLKLNYLTTTSYDLVLQSGEEYDIIAAPDWLGFWSNVNRGAFAEITDEELQQNAPYVWEEGQKYLYAARKDGKLYGIPGIYEYASDRLYAVRGDLMDKYGIPDLNSMENVDKYLMAVAKNEPDMIAFDMPGTSPWTLLGMFASDWGYAALGTLSFGEHVYFDVDNPDAGFFLAVDRPETIEFSNMMKKWMDNGVFSKSVLSNKIDTTSSFKNGRSAMASIANPSTAESLYNELQADERKAWDVRFYPVYREKQRMNGYLNSSISISKFTENKADALKIINECFENEEIYMLLKHGIKGVHWDESEDGYFVMLDSANYKPFTDGLANMYWELPTKLTVPGNEELTAKLKAICIDDPYVNCPVDTEAVKEIKVALDEVYKTYTTQRMYGVVDDVEKAIADEKQALKKAGVDKYIEVLNECKKEFDNSRK